MKDTVNFFTPEELVKAESECRARQQRIADVLADYEILPNETDALKETILALALELKTKAKIYEADKLKQTIYDYLDSHYSGSVHKTQYLDFINEAVAYM